MNASTHNTPSPGMNLGDIYYVIFRHKWKVLACAALGLVAAFSLHTVYRPPYQSEAKLFVRYVISDGKAVGPGAVDSTSKSPDQRGETIMASETEILSSADLAQQVVQAIGAERILAKVDGGRETSVAVRYIRENLSVRVPQGSSVIHIIFRHPDSEVVQPVLREVVDRYLKMHVEIHRAAGMLGDLFSQERDRLRSRLADTEEELRQVRNRAGVISIEDAKKSYTEQISELRQQIFRTQAELAERNSILESLSHKNDDTKVAADAPESVKDELRDEYTGLLARIQFLTKREQELLTQFTSDNSLVKETRAQLLEAQNTRRRLQAANPQLARAELSSSEKVGGAEAFDPVTATAQIAALKSRLTLLTAQLAEVRADASKVDQLEGTMSELKLQKELQESNYRYFSAGLEQTRINETLGSGRVSNISQIQTPSAPYIDTTKNQKLMRVLAVGGLVLGLAWAFAIELFFDRSVKRAIDVERLTKYPLLLTIPALSRKQLKNSGAELALANEEKDRGLAETNLLHTFHETLRDRLISYFDSKGLTHKPKLVAVSSMNKNAGTTTTAAGLARSLSETGEGNVLLVDMTGGQGSAQHFVKGKAVCGLDEMFSERDSAHVQENLYVVEANNNSDRLYKNLPQRFSKLVPKLKASDFDYVIFDMPPVSQISITPRLAGFMDMVLLVVESEKTDRDIVAGGTALLAESRAHVAVVLNKTKSYVPRRLQQELFSS